MPQIHLLDTQTSNLIAAGEVVERPANAVKEMLENAIDAGAKMIVCEIRAGGQELIRISDNGCGISREDLPLAIRRHATSKIKTAQDLNGIATLGFRGEALAAISATSRFTIMTKRAEDEFGSQMQVEGEEILSIEDCGCADGTTVIARELFFNQPARKKFLKRAQTESAAVYQAVQRIAVSHPEIAFRFISDGETKMQTVGNGKLDECIYSVYGKEFAAEIIPIKSTPSPYRISGFITRPEFSRGNRSHQSFYINNRYVNSKTMQFALADAYKSFVKSEKFPGCVLFLEIDFSTVDVNVHPAKLEVRFSDERSVYNAIYSAVRSTLENLSNQLARDAYFKELEAMKASAPAAPARTVTPIHEKVIYTPVKSDPVKSVPSAFELPLFASAKPVSKPLFSEEKKEEKKSSVEVEITTLPSLTEENSKTTAKKEEPKPLQESAAQPEQITISEAAGEIKKDPKDNPLLNDGVIRGTFFHAFIAYETEDALYLIDKHAAHERILYEGLKARKKDRPVQMLMTPVIIRLNPTGFSAVTEHLEELQEAGFQLEEFGMNSLALRSIPADFVHLSGSELTEMMEKTAQELTLGGRADGVKNKAFDRTLYSMACKAAVKAGIPSSGDEWIVEKLKQYDNIIVCPHGRPILVKFTRKQIENLFLRD